MGATVKQQQQQLSMLGLYTSKIDGISGPHTKEAISDFVELEQVEKDWDSVLLNKIRAMNPLEYATPEIQLLFSANPNPMQWSDAVRNNFRDHAKQYFLPAVKELCKHLYMPMKQQIAYIMATVEHETFGTFLPVKEAFYVSDKAQREYLQKMPYGVQWAARGHVGLTWLSNYEKYSYILGLDLVANPDLALEPDISLFILIHGMKTGAYTNRRLDLYINEYTVDYVKARKIVNGTDKAEVIAGLAQHWEQEIVS